MTTPSDTTTGSPRPPEDAAHPSPDSWERVAGTLRACKEAQTRAWGDLDSSTLGRYLAGEVAGDELALIERELADHAELRQLTDLVRDVLGDLGPVAEPAPAPTVLSFEKARKPRRVLPFLRRHAALVAAACLLVALGAVVPAGRNPPPGEDILTMESSERVALHGTALASTALFTTVGSPTPAEMAGDDPLPTSEDREAAKRELIASQSPRLAGATESKKMTSRDAAANHRRGQDHLRRGRVAEAEKSLAKTYAHCQESLGANHPITTQAAQELAYLYAPALNDGLSRKSFGDSAPHPVMMMAPNTPADQPEANRLGEQIANQTLPQIRATVVPVLVRALQTAPTPAQRQTMVVALGNLGPAAGPALPALRQSLENATPAESRAILETMGLIGPAAVPVLDRLAGDNATNAAKSDRPNALSDRDRRFARVVLGKLRSPEAQAGVADEAACLSFREIRTASMQLHRLTKTKGLGILVLIQTKAACRPGDAACLPKLGKHGVHVVLDLAGRVEVEVSPALAASGFSATAVREAMLAPCKAKQYDKACNAGIALILAQAGKLKSAPPEAAPRIPRVPK